MISTEKKRTFEIEVQADLLEARKEAETIQLTAYAFSSEARFLNMTALDGKGHAQLELPGLTRAGTVRVLVGPSLSKGDKPDFAELMRRGAQEQHVHIDPLKQLPQARFTIAPILWNCWLRSACFVKGTLLKRTIIGDSELDLPVCDAKVEIYEVDPLYLLIPRLPDFVLDRLRDFIAGPVRELIPEPRPGEALLARAAVSENRLAAPALAQEPARQSSELRAAAASGSKVELRQALIQHPALVRPLLWRYFPRFMSMQKVATATTDSCGHFNALFFQGCFTHDKPDLYFKARQRLSATYEITIYEPKPIGANTWWNYASGTEVTLYTTHPQAYTCSPCPPVHGPGANRWVAFLSIGNTSLGRIHGTSKELSDTTPTAEQAGRLGLTDDGRPWGGLLRPRLVFSETLEAAGVTYYRVAWRRAGAGSFQPLQGGIQHYYRHEVSTPDGTFPAWSPVTLGPHTVGDEVGLMKIPYLSLLPAGATWEPPSGGNDLIDHLSSAVFPTHELAPGLRFESDGTPVTGTADHSGLYELEVQLFDTDGKLVDVDALGIKFAVPSVPDLSGSIATVNADDPALDLVQGSSMIIKLRVDNNGCFAHIDAPTIGSAAADDCCGVLDAAAGDDVKLPYTAHHPHGFARYHFDVVRGVTSVASVPAGAPASAALTAMSITRSVSALMTSNPAPGCGPDGCAVAGFSETLRVDSLATDGWSYGVAGSATSVRAFVLSRTTP